MATKPNDDSSLSHTRWNCKYHIVFIPKYRRKEIYGQIKSDILFVGFKDTCWDGCLYIFRKYQIGNKNEINGKIYAVFNFYICIFLIIWYNFIE